MSSPERVMPAPESLWLINFKIKAERRLNSVSLADVIVDLVGGEKIRADTQAQADAVLELARNKYPLPEHKDTWIKAFNSLERGFSIFLFNGWCGSWMHFALENFEIDAIGPKDCTNLEDYIHPEIFPLISSFLNSGKLPDILRKIPHILGKLDSHEGTFTYYLVGNVFVGIEYGRSLGLYFNRDFFDKFISAMDTLLELAIHRGDAGIVSEAQKAMITEMIADYIIKASDITLANIGDSSEMPLIEALRKLKEYEIFDLDMMKSKLLEKTETVFLHPTKRDVMEAVLNDIDNILDERSADAGERRIIRSAGGGGGAGGGSAGGSRPKFS